MGSNPAAPTNVKSRPFLLVLWGGGFFSVWCIWTGTGSSGIVRPRLIWADHIYRVEHPMTAIYAIVAFIAVMAILNKMTFGRFD